MQCKLRSRLRDWRETSNDFGRTKAPFGEQIPLSELRLSRASDPPHPVSRNLVACYVHCLAARSTETRFSGFTCSIVTRAAIKVMKTTGTFYTRWFPGRSRAMSRKSRGMRAMERAPKGDFSLPAESPRSNSDSRFPSLMLRSPNE